MCVYRTRTNLYVYRAVVVWWAMTEIWQVIGCQFEPTLRSITRAEAAPL
jgi:hypothetical protein